MDHPSSGGAENSFNSSLSALHSTSGDEYHMVHNDHDDLTDVHTANSPASTPPPIVLNRKSSSPTGSNSSTELEDSPGSAVCTGKYFPRHVRCSQRFSLAVSTCVFRFLANEKLYLYYLIQM